MRGAGREAERLPARQLRQRAGECRDVEAPAYDDLAREQVALATSGRANDEAALQDLVNGGDTWLVDDSED